MICEQIHIDSSPSTLVRPQVLIVGLTTPPIGGVAVCVESLLNASRLQHSFELFIHDPSKGLPSESGFRWFCFRVFRFLLRQMRRDALEEIRLKLLLRTLIQIPQLRLAHVHTSSFSSFWMNARLMEEMHRRNIPVILHMHGGGFRDFFAQADSEEKQRILNILAQPEALIALSEAWQTFYQQLVPDQVVFILPNPINDVSPPVTGSERQAVLFLGHITRKKGVLDLLQAWAEVRTELPEAELWLAGPDLEGIVRNLTSAELKQSRVVYHGLVEGEAKQHLLKESALMALPSYFEGLPIVVLEALGMGLPVVATPVGAIPEVITDGDEGLLVPVGDIQAISGAIIRLLENPESRFQMGKLGYERISQRYHIDRISVELATIYQQLLEESSDETSSSSE